MYYCEMTFKLPYSMINGFKVVGEKGHVVLFMTSTVMTETNYRLSVVSCL